MRRTTVRDADVLDFLSRCMDRHIRQLNRTDVDSTTLTDSIRHAHGFIRIVEDSRRTAVNAMDVSALEAAMRAADTIVNSRRDS